MSKFKKYSQSTGGGAVVLLGILLILVLLSALIYNFTQPLAKQNRKDEEQKLLTSLVYNADKFEKFKAEDMPKGVNGVYKAANNQGYVFHLRISGYKGPVEYLVGINSKGLVEGIEVVSSKETPGIGTEVFKSEHKEKFYGDANEKNVDAVAGATVTSNTMKKAVTTAKSGFEKLNKEAD